MQELQARKTPKQPVRTTPVPNRRSVEGTVSRLKEAFHRHGIVLPSLGVDLLGFCNTPPRHLVQLGRVNEETAEKLLKVLEGDI